MSGEVPQGVKSLWELLPSAPYTYPSGIKDTDKGIIRYAYPSTTYPNLIIADPICDNDGNTIMPGYYELALSYDRQTLILLQNGNMVATIPVFKYEEDKEMGKQIQNYKELKAQRKEEAKKEKQNKDRAKKCLPPIDKPIYMNATIEYDAGGDYYLVKYEREKIKAWGAIRK